MSDRELGGFYASQDADINLDDDGDYFTWTLAEARLALLAANFSPRHQPRPALLGDRRTRRHTS